MSQKDATNQNDASKKVRKGKKKNFISNFFMDLLGGDFLVQDWARRQISFILFLAGIALVYIANSYYTESISRKIDTISREMKELQFEYISSKSQVMQDSKQSEVARKLAESGLKESVEPVKKIVVQKKKN